MSAWRREALKYLPQHAEQIEQAGTVSALLSELWFEFKEAYQKDPKDEPLIAGVYSFAAWCWHGSDFTGNHLDLITAVFGYFYEPLPKDLVRRRDMPHYLCLEEFEVLQAGPLAYYLSPDEHLRMVAEFRNTKAKTASQTPEHCGKLKNLSL